MPFDIFDELHLSSTTVVLGFSNYRCSPVRVGGHPTKRKRDIRASSSSPRQKTHEFTV